MHEQIHAAVAEAFAPKPDPEAVQAAAVSEAARTLAAAKTKAQPVVTFKASSVDEHGVIYGVAASTGLDHEGETTEKGAIVRMAYDFCGSDQREFKANHGETLKAKLVASMPGAPIYAEDGVTITGIDITRGQECMWFVGVKPEDPAIVEAAKSQQITGFSWAGLALRAEG
jgi:hypothetical protein